MIRSIDFNGVRLTLVDMWTRQVVSAGARRIPDVGEPRGFTVVGGKAPQHPGSSGKVWVREDGQATVREFYPGVFGLEWAELPMVTCSVCRAERDREETWSVSDARGIYCGRVCSDRCEKRLEERYRPDIFTDPDYWTDEPVEPESW